MVREAIAKRGKLPCFLCARFIGFVRRLTSWFTDSRFVIGLVRIPITNAFNRLYYRLRKNTFDSTYFMGKHLLKFPTDLWTYQEIIWDKRPNVIVETGVFLGGSTYFLATMANMICGGRIIAVDITLDHVDADLYKLPNVTLLEGDSSNPETLSRIRSLIRSDETVMVVLDSDHATEHVYKEMKLLSEIVSPGQYLVVEDGIVDRVYPPFCNNGPIKAIKRFLSSNAEFSIDYYRSRFLLTQNPMGYLLRGTGSAEEALLDVTYLDCFRPAYVWLPHTPPPSAARWFASLNQNKAREHKEVFSG
jgi:cephalosporin hydroxylase